MMLSIGSASALLALSADGAIAEKNSLPVKPSSELQTCANRVVRDYDRVFSRLPKVSRPRKNGRLPFGPRGIYLEESPTQILVPGNSGGDAFTFRLRSFGDNGGVLRLNWAVRVRLASIDRYGNGTGSVVSEESKLGRISVRALTYRPFDLWVPNKPGLYRAEIEFKRLDSGKPLGKFAQYLRVLRPRTSARLRIFGDQAVKPGGSVVARVENPGTRQLYLPAVYRLDRYEDGYWNRNVGEVFANVPNIVRSAEAGMAGECESIPVPVDSPQGLYRVRAPVFVGREPEGHWLNLVDEFLVQ